MPSDLEGRIAELFDSLSPKQQALSRLILDNRYYASFASAAELGAKVDASAATVIRLCQALGYQGLPDLQETIRADLPSYLTAVERLEQRLTMLPNGENLPQRVFAIDVQNLQRTASATATAPFNAAVRHIATARETVVVATGVAAAPASFLAYSLQVIGLRARAVLDGDVTLAAIGAHLTSDDALIAIGMWRYVRSTVEAIAQAKAQGVITVAFTDSIVSPLARSADYAFEVATEGATHSLSMTGTMSLINAVVAGVSLVDPVRTGQALQRVDRQFISRNLLML